MAQLKDIWVESDLADVDNCSPKALRIDWDNDRHHRIEIKGDEPKHLIKALDFAVRLLKSEMMHKEI